MVAGNKVFDRPRLLSRQGSKISEPAASHFPRGHFTRLFGKPVVGHESGQCFGPVAAFMVDSDPMTPPGMQDLVGQRTLLHEGERQDTLAYVRKRRETKTHRQWAVSYT